MPDAIAPAAPAPAAPISSSAPAAGKPATGAKPVAPKAGPGAGRTTDGRFLTKDGTAGVEKPAAEQQPGETKEEYRFRRKLKSYGKEEEVDYSEDDIARELQELRMHRKKSKDSQENTTRAQRIIELANSNPEAFLRETGQDPDEFARTRLTKFAQVAAMSEDERKIHELTQKAEALETKEKEREAKTKEWEQRYRKQQLIEKRKGVYKEALGGLDFETTHETIFLMAEAEGAAKARGIELTPQELGQETVRRMGQFVEQYFAGLDGKGLAKRLGPKRVQAILEASISDFEASHGIASAPAPTPVSAPTPGGPEYVDEKEIARRLKAWR